MAGRPRTTQLPALPRCSIPEPPEEFTAQEKDVWVRYAHEVDLAGTYDSACYGAFRNAVRLWAAEESLDLSPAAVDTAATRVIGLANTARGYFGLNPAARKKVPGAPLSSVNNPDDEFFADRPQLRAVPPPKAKAKPVATPDAPARKPWEKTA